MTMAIRGEIWTGEEERVGWKEMCERDDFWPRTLAACCFISRCRVYHPLITGQRKSSDLAPPRDGDVQLPPWHRITKKQGRAASMLRAPSRSSEEQGEVQTRLTSIPPVCTPMRCSLAIAS